MHGVTGVAGVAGVAGVVKVAEVTALTGPRSTDHRPPTTGASVGRARLEGRTPVPECHGCGTPGYR
ncbi:hypothetical protein ACFQ51_01180 [Streptomyces kaempferi]